MANRLLETASYYSYLIRLWRLDNAGTPVWRAALQEPGSDAQILFESPAALWAYLEAQIGLSAGEATPERDPPEAGVQQARAAGRSKTTCGEKTT